MFETFLITLLIIAVAVLFLGIRLLLGRAFINTHVEGSKALREKGIGCAKEQARDAFKENPHRVSERRQTSTH